MQSAGALLQLRSGAAMLDPFQMAVRQAALACPSGVWQSLSVTLQCQAIYRELRGVDAVILASSPSYQSAGTHDRKVVPAGDAGRVFMLRSGAVGWREDTGLEESVHRCFRGTGINAALLEPRVIEMRAAIAFP